MKTAQRLLLLALVTLLAIVFVGCNSCGTVTGKDGCGTFKATGLNSTSGCAYFYGKMGTQNFNGVKYTFTKNGSKVTFKLDQLAVVDSHYKKMTGTISGKTIKMDGLDLWCTVK